MKQHFEIITNIVGEVAAQALCQKYTVLTELAKAETSELIQIPGIGPAKARSIKAALELAIRLSHETIGESPLLDHPEAIAGLLRDETRPYTTETFRVILLNTRRRLIRVHTVATGTLDTLLVHPREVFRHAIANNAAAICLFHNHPSGDPTPSDSDAKTTRDLIRAGQLLKIEVVDHIILGLPSPSRSKDYVSMRELGFFYS